MQPVPALGDRVHYTLGEPDVAAINSKYPAPHNEGRNPVYAGNVYPATIVRVWGSTPQSSVNLQVHLDGDMSYWATSRTPGEGPFHFTWPTPKELAHPVTADAGKAQSVE